MKLRNIILSIVLLVLLLCLLVFTSSINVNNQDNNSSRDLNNLEYDSSNNLANPTGGLNNLEDNSNNNQANSDVNSDMLDNDPTNNQVKPNNNLNNPNKPDNNLNKPNNNSNNPNKPDSNLNKPNNNLNNPNKPDNNLNKPNNNSNNPNKPDSNLNKPNNNSNNSNKQDNYSNNVNKSNSTNININKPNILKLGSNNMGSVELIGPIGNSSSNVKIAYIIGVHPLEFYVHNALYNSLIARSDSLKYSYYIYKVNVTSNPNNYDIGRMNGQSLANKFLVPDATSKNYDLVIDIHSNQGLKGGNYKETNFIFAPLNNPSSKAFADEIIAKIPPLVYYYPESQTSPSYVTIPIMESGTPTLIYETYLYESNEITKDYINKLITTIDNLKFK